MALSQAGDPTFIMRDPAGKDRVALWRDGKGEGLALADQKGQARLALAVQDGQDPTLTFYKNGEAYQTIK
jgi:hypothetical protein